MTNYFYKFIKYYERFLEKDHLYLIAMTIYHFEILLLITLLGIEFKVHTFLPMITPDHAGNLGAVNFHFSLSSLNSILLSMMILLIDFVFLFILRSEIKRHEEQTHKKVGFSIFGNWIDFNLSNKQIILIEILVFYFSIGNPFMRAALYFMSFNTIQIYVTYRIIFNFPYLGQILFKPLLILGAYISIINLALYPIWTVVSLYLIYGR